MPHPMETTLTAREASFVADIGYDRVAKAFDGGRVANVSRSRRTRRLDIRGAFSLAAAERLKLYPAPVREHIQGQIDAAIDAALSLSDVRDVECRDQVLVTTFKATKLARLVEERLGKLARLHDLVVVDNQRQGGAPTFRGTRIMVRHLAGLVRSRVARQEIAEDFPEVTDEMLEVAELYDRIYPQRGRPVVTGAGA